jgi:hypothetical protein
MLITQLTTTAIGYEVKPIDGIGRILGQSSPLSTRTGPYVDSLGQTQLPISAGMEFDVADVVRTTNHLYIHKCLQHYHFLVHLLLCTVTVYHAAHDIVNTSLRMVHLVTPFQSSQCWYPALALIYCYCLLPVLYTLLHDTVCITGRTD